MSKAVNKKNAKEPESRVLLNKMTSGRNSQEAMSQPLDEPQKNKKIAQRSTTLEINN